MSDSMRHEPESLRPFYHFLDPQKNEFRLLRVLPAERFEDEIRCELFHSVLENSPPYEAISYAWGDHNDTSIITLDNQKCQVTRNVELFMRYIRLSDGPRVIWVDALCINQMDNKEKAHQVRAMRKIYVNVLQVIVWLGEYQGNDAEELLDRYTDAQSALRAQSLAKDEAKLRELFFRPWWQRYWILQEVLHRRPVVAYIGSLRIDFDVLCMQYSNFMTLFYLSHTPATPKEKALYSAPALLHYRMMLYQQSFADVIPDIMHDHRRYLLQVPQGAMTLERCLKTFRTQLCTDSRDKVFGILGLIQPEEAADITIDYGASKESIYTATMRCILQFPSSCWSLLLVQSPARSISSLGMPSWVPDWSLQQDYFSASKYFEAGFNVCRRRGLEDIHLPRWLVDAPEKFILSGLRIGTVLEVAEYEINTESAWPVTNLSKMMLFRYCEMTSSNDAYQAQEDQSLEMSLLNASWGPPKIEAGDLIILSSVSLVPLILRSVHADAYHFVGGCCLVDSLLQGGENEFVAMTEDPGFSQIMHGSAWDEGKIEEFWIG